MIDVKTFTLLAFSENKNFSKTAVSLHMSQPNVSYQIGALEKEYGIKIYRNEQGKISITKEGYILAKYAKRLIEQDSNARQALKNFSRDVSSIVVGITPTAEETMVPQIFAKYSSLHPNVHIKIISSDIRNIYDMMRDFSIDLAIVEGQIHDPNYKSLLIDTDFLCLAVAPENKLADKQIVTIDELKHENLILRLPNSGTRILFESTLLANRETLDNFNVTMEIDNINTIKELVESNYGVSVIANSYCLEEAHKKKLILIPIEKMSMVREINLIYHNDFTNMQLLSDIQQIYLNSKK
jgi:DNA-binding transcriptional LysR family regulator